MFAASRNVDAMTARAGSIRNNATFVRPKRHKGTHGGFKTPRNLAVAVAITAGSLGLGGCGGGVITQHGYVASETALEQIQIGSSKEQVRLIMGTPTTSAAIGDNVYFYVSETKQQLYFFKPKTIDRRILTFHFDEEDRVARVANYGLKDGVIFDFISRKTPTRGDELTVLNEMLGNLSNFGRPVN